MEWREEGIVVGTKRHGETAVILDVFTRGRGHWHGLVRGGRSRRLRPVLQPGNLVQAAWRARLEEHLGSFTVEPLALKVAGFIDDPFKLAGLTTLTALVQLLPEREPHERLYDAMQTVLGALEDDDVWPTLAVRWEMGLLDDLGFGLDLEKCAATGLTEDLIYVSPKSGRAVSAEAGLPYREKLFQLPGFLKSAPNSEVTNQDVLHGFALTGHFLRRHLFEPRGLNMPEQRDWIIQHISAAR
jgi:DNA repair protein RecO (recombination protein O)